MMFGEGRRGQASGLPELPERGRRLMEPSASGSSNRPERGLLVEEGLPGVLFGVLH
jgi:hypothetical protein